MSFGENNFSIFESFEGEVSGSSFVGDLTDFEFSSVFPLIKDLATSICFLGNLGEILDRREPNLAPNLDFCFSGSGLGVVGFGAGDCKEEDGGGGGDAGSGTVVFSSF